MEAKEALELQIDLWSFIANSQKHIINWDGWSNTYKDYFWVYEYKDEKIPNACFLLKYFKKCCECPYAKKYDGCLEWNDNEIGIMNQWLLEKYTKRGSKIAKKFVEQLNGLEIGKGISK